ncbi:hypothetical protein Tco_0828129 [Tanacetum coccineum]
MVAYLQKSEGSEGFHQIVYFLTVSHISTLENGDIEITATIDGKVKQLAQMSNMKRASKGYTRVDTPLFQTMLVQVPQPSSPTQTHVADEAASTGVDVRHGGATTNVSSLDA